MQLNTKIKLNIGFLVGFTMFFGLFAFTTPANAQYAVASCNSATLNGFIDSNQPTTTAWFEWGTSPSLGNTTSHQTFYPSYSQQNISRVINGLTPNTEYYYKVFFQNENYNTPISTYQISFRTTCDNAGGTNPGNTTPATASISITPATCTSPCDIKVNITSSNVENILKVYRNGSFIWNRYGNQSDSETDWGKGAGTYEYCVRNVNKNWMESGNLDCKTVTVGAQAKQNATATISSTQNCTAPCDVQINWNSNNVGSIVRIYKNGQVLWNQSANVSGSEKDWNMQAGTYRYCIRAVGNNWSESGDLNCSTTTVTTQAVQNPSATISSTTPCIAPCNIVVKWSSVDVAPNPNIVKIYKNGSFLWNQTGNTPINFTSGTEWAMPAGTYTYCIKAVKSDWTETPCLANSTSVVTMPVTHTCQDNTAINYGGTLPCKHVNLPAPTLSMAAPSSAQINSPFEISWDSTNASEVLLPSSYLSLDNGCTVSPNLSVNNLLNITKTVTCNTVGAKAFQITVWNLATSGAGRPQATQRKTVNITSAPIVVVPNPTVTISANPSNINSNRSSLITWNSLNATSCVASGGTNGWAGNKSLNSDWNTGPLRANTTYNITCYNSEGTQVNRSVTITVNARSRFSILTLPKN